MKALNRLKEVLVKIGNTGKWLADTMGKDPATVSRWCNNHYQPSIEMLDKIAQTLDVNIQTLLIRSK